MPNAVMHPSTQELSAFALGKLADAVAAAIARHLETCSTCRQAIEKLPADSFVGKVRAARPSVSSLPPRPARIDSSPNVSATEEVALKPLKDLPAELAGYSKYRFVRELGRGGMGVVYQAEQTVMGRSVAVKVINPSVLNHPDALPRFQSEVRAAAKLDHPNIVLAYDAEQVASLHLLVMEYVEGTSLAELVARKGPLSVPYACHYVRQAALGLQHAFEQGMVHRDIKPQNLMVNARGQVKVLDFGLARMRSQRRQEGCGLTQADAFMGTPEYVSPEQATDARSADTRADIYSLGCTLFFLLTGRPPFQEDTIVKQVLAQIEKEPPGLHDVRPEVPLELSAVAARMLAKDPAQRFQTPIEAAEALAAFVKPGAKRPSGVALPAAGVAMPAAGTRIAAETSKIKAILHELPRKVPDSKAPSKPAAASSFAGPGEEVASAKKVKPAPKAPRAWYRSGPVLAAAAAVLALGLGVSLVAGIVFKTKVKTADGEAFIVLEIDQPDVEVTVDGQTISVRVPGDNKPVEIKVEPDRPHKLRVSKDGFVVVSRDVELQSGKSAPIRVHLEPVKAAAKGEDADKGSLVSSVTPTDPKLRQATSHAGKWSIDGDEIVQESTRRMVYTLVFGSSDWTDYDFTCKVRKIHGQGEIGLVYRAGKGRSGQLIVGRYDGSWLSASSKEDANTDGKYDRLQERRTAPLEQDRWYKLHVRLRGEHCQCFFDDEAKPALEFDDPKDSQGAVGLWTWATAARFRDIRVTDPAGKVLWQGLPTLAAAAASIPSLSDGVIRPAQAADKEGQKVTVQLRVQGVGVNGEFLELYSEPEWNRDGNLFLRFSESTRKKFDEGGIPDVVRHFHGKLIRATGTVTILSFEAGSYPCIVIDDLDQILICDPDKPRKDTFVPRLNSKSWWRNLSTDTRFF